MYPRAVHASLLMYSLSTQVDTYTICLVLCPERVSLSSRSVAPTTGRWLLLAALMLMLTGMSLLSGMPRSLMSSVPVRQLWQPVSAIAHVVVVLPLMGCFVLLVPCSGGTVLIASCTCGWGSDAFLVHERMLGS